MSAGEIAKMTKLMRNDRNWFGSVGGDGIERSGRRSFSILPTAFSLLIALTVCSSCKNGGVEPPPPPAGTDTTSHEFVWQIDTLGDASSILNDVFIIDENNIWAVGEIYLRDSTGQIDPQAYNAAVWDGNTWKVRRVTVDFRGNMITPPLEGIIAFSSTDIWLVGSLPIHGDGTNWVLHDLRSMPRMDSVSLSKAWGASSLSIYFVGRAGSLVFFNGSSWQKLESGTSLTIQDIWGAKNEATGEWDILAVASNRQINEGKEVLRLSSTSVTKLPTVGLPWSLRGVWFVPGKKYYVIGDGIYHTSSIDSLPPWDGGVNEITTYYGYAIRGNGVNDVVICGAFGDFLHFNGSTWHQYAELQQNDRVFYRVAFKGNTIAIVGIQGNRALAIRGTRY